jgi:Zn-dependent M32 family carboxypeptidase
MNNESHDPRDIPILTETVGADTSDLVARDSPSRAVYDAKSVHAAIVTETLNFADSLLHQAAKDIEAALFERVFDQLRAQLPELVDRVLREHAISNSPTDGQGHD